MLSNKLTNIKYTRKEGTNYAVTLSGNLDSIISHNTTVNCASRWFCSRKDFSPLPVWIPSLDIPKEGSLDSLNYRIFSCITQY